MKPGISKAIIISVFFIILIAAASVAQDETIEVEGRVIRIDIGSSKDPANPQLWPAILLKNKTAVLLGSPVFLEELYYLEGAKALLHVKQFPKQTFGQKEYECFEVGEIKKIEGREYISTQAAINEFKEALKIRNLIDDAGRQTIKEAVKNIWFDKNKNGVIDVGDRLFVAEKTTGKINGSQLLYPSKVVIRQQKHHLVFYDTFVVNDPIPNNFEPAIFGRLNYEPQANSYSIITEKIYKGGNGFSIPSRQEKNITLGSNDTLKPFIDKSVLLLGEKYDNIMWYTDTPQEITRKNGQYIITVKGKVFLVIVPAQKPWGLSLILLKDKSGNLYELRRVGYLGSWRNMINQEVVITGALRPRTFYKDKLIFALEVLSIE